MQILLHQTKSHFILGLRAAVYALLIGLLSFGKPLLSIESMGSSSYNQIFLLSTLIMAVQALVSFLPKPETSIVPLFLCDIIISSVIIRYTGASTSPFIVLYPLLALGSSILFTWPVATGYVAIILLFLIATVGTSTSIIGTSMAILTTALLGIYLTQALSRSSLSLKVSEDARRRLENLQKIILSNIPSGLLSIDNTGLIIQINQVGLQILGMKESDVIHKKLWNIIPQLPETAIHEALLKPKYLTNPGAIKTERPTVLYKNAQGNEQFLGYSIAPLTDIDKNQTVGTLVVFQDLTEITNLEKGLRMSEKLAAVGKLAASIAHEIRNPLAGISGSAQLLQSLQDLEDEDRKLLEIILRESKRLDSLISEFLEYVRPPQLKLDPINIKELVTQLIENLQVNSKWKELGCKIEFQVRENGELPQILGEPNKITQALLNLAMNAGQAGAKHVTIRFFKTGLLEIVDDGPGISAENQKRIFEPFFTTKEKGTGLGLAITYKVLEAMGARVSFLSPVSDFAPPRGTSFSIQFQLSSSEGKLES